MEEAAERLLARADILHHTGDIGGGTDIGLCDLHADALCAQTLDERFSLRRGRAAAAREHEMPCAELDQPLRDDFAEAAEGAGDEVASVRLDGEGRRERDSAAWDEGVGE